MEGRQLSLEIWRTVFTREMDRGIEHLISKPFPERPKESDFDTLHEYWQESNRRDQAVKRKVDDIEASAWRAAEDAVIRGTLLSWPKIRKTVWERDNGVCQVCNRTLTLKEYHCGHIIDRVADGSDLPENLLVMCHTCNMHKPVHDTREEFEAWVENGFWRGDLADIITKHLEGLDLPIEL